MHAISSYRGNKTHTQMQPQTHRQDRLQYTAPLSLARNVTGRVLSRAYTSAVAEQSL